MTIAYLCLCTQVRESAIDFITRNRAALDVDQAMRVAPKKTDHTVLRMHSDAIAICVLGGRSDNRSHGKVFEFADALESVTNLSPLDGKLVFIANVLVSASATAAEIGTLWFNAIRRVLLYFDELRFGELFFLAHDFRRNNLALDDVGDEDRLPLVASDTFPAKSDVFNFQIDNAHVINTLV
jgi:hypothetical protein